MFSLLCVLCAIFAAYFSIGRATCPPTERLPWHELSNDDVTANIRRGWHTLGQHSRLARMTAEMHRVYR